MSAPRPPLPESAEGYGITLRRWRPTDAELLHRIVVESVDHLRPWMDWISLEPRTVEERRAMLETWDDDWARGGDVAYAILVADEAVGGCGLHWRRGARALEIGYWTHPAFVRRGVASTAARLLTDVAFATPGIERVEIHHDRANRASAAIPRRLGYRLLGEEPDERAAPAELGIDCAWSVTREEWATIDPHSSPRSSAG